MSFRGSRINYEDFKRNFPAELKARDIALSFGQNENEVCVTRKEKPVALTPARTCLLALLMRDVGKTLSERKMQTEICGPTSVDDVTLGYRIAAQISYIRTALGPPNIIVKIPGEGYQLLESGEADAGNKSKKSLRGPPTAQPL